MDFLCVGIWLLQVKGQVLGVKDDAKAKAACGSELFLPVCLTP